MSDFHGNILLYQTADGATKIEVALQDETVWLTIDQMADLFQRNKSTISRHLKNIFESGEVDPNRTVAFFATTQNKIVSLYLDFAELQAENHVPMYMKDWIAKLDDFLKLSGKQLLTHAGTVSAEVARLKADAEYDRFQNRVRNQLSPVEMHFIESFERSHRRLGDGGPNSPER